MDKKFIITCVVALLIILYFIGTRNKKTDEDTSTDETKKDKEFSNENFDINNPISVPKNKIEEIRNIEKITLKPFKE